MRTSFLKIAICFACGCASPSRQGLREISTAPPSSSNAPYNLEMRDLGFSLTVPNGRWRTEWLPDPPALRLWRPGRDVEIRIQVCNLPRIGDLDGYVAQQRQLIMRGRAGSYVHVETLKDEYDGRKGFEMELPGPDRSTRVVKLILAPMPGRIDQALLILISGESEDFRYMRIASRFVIESIRRIDETSAVITAPGTGPDL